MGFGGGWRRNLDAWGRDLFGTCVEITPRRRQGRGSPRFRRAGADGLFPFFVCAGGLPRPSGNDLRSCGILSLLFYRGGQRCGGASFPPRAAWIPPCSSPPLPPPHSPSCP